MADGEQTAQTARNTQADGVQDAAGNQGEASEAQTPQFEPLTVTYERLRHSTDPQELHEFARRPLPDRAKQAAFSRATALLEAVAGNQHTPLEDRVFLAETMPFPNVLVKLSEDPSPEVRRAVAANRDAVDPAIVEHEKAIYMAQAAESGKPEAIQEKMATGRLEKFFKESTLTEQAFVKNPDQSVSEYTDEVAKNLGGTIGIVDFKRFVLGEEA